MNLNLRLIASLAAPASLALLLAPGCAHVKVDPIKVEPIHIVHDINIRVDRQLDEFFAFQEKANAATQPTTTQTATADDAQGVTP
jgi:hypothetical protein